MAQTYQVGGSVPGLVLLVAFLMLPAVWSPFVPRRRVTMHIENLTDRVKEWSKLTRLEFNAKLNDWYNEEERK